MLVRLRLRGQWRRQAQAAPDSASRSLLALAAGMGVFGAGLVGAFVVAYCGLEGREEPWLRATPIGVVGALAGGWVFADICPPLRYRLWMPLAACAAAGFSFGTVTLVYAIACVDDPLRTVLVSAAVAAPMIAGAAVGAWVGARRHRPREGED